MSFPFAALPEAVRGFRSVLQPPELMSPSEFAARYRYVKEGTTDKPGRWRNDVFPYLTAIMDAIEEAIRTGKKGLVLMKSGQGGGSEAMINAFFWLKIMFPGPFLYLISKDEHAIEFSRERFDHINKTCEPISTLVLTGKGSGDTLHIKRYSSGKIVIHGGRSVLNLESQPYRIVFIDEYDSLLAEFAGKGDPLANAEIRVDGFSGQTLIVCFAHPTVEDHGVGKLYYERSDQRRAHVTCCHCGEQFWLQWDHVKVVEEGDETTDQARRNPRRYVYVAPCCGTVITDGERYSMVKRGTPQISTLPPEEAAQKEWIGVHFGQLYMYKPLSWLAGKWIEGLDNPAIARVFVNKRMGDVFRTEVQGSDPEQWRACIIVPRSTNDRMAYSRGTVPPAVSYLTAGQDSKQTELHWAVWGWGLVRDAGKHGHRCGWLIDCGVVERVKTETIEAVDLLVFDDLFYDRKFPRTDGTEPLMLSAGYHDMGWCGLAVQEYCQRRPGISVPARGDALDRIRAARTQPHRWGPKQKQRLHGIETELQPGASLNTYLLKQRLFGMVQTRFELPGDQGSHGLITLPQDVSNRFIAESSAESLKKVKGKLVWTHRGPNHFSDCNVQALGAAINATQLDRRTRDEYVQEAKQEAEAAQRRRQRRDRNTRGGVRRSY